MGLFSHKAPLSALFRGYVDCHSHILPGVDDGVRSVEDSLKILSAYHDAGVSEVWLTPHIMEDCPNAPDALRERFEYLKAQIDEKGVEVPVLHLAAENMMDGLFSERLAQNDVLVHFPRHLLVETSYYNPPFDLDGILYNVKSKGYFPILAHPERYLYMSDKDYERLKSDGVKFQLNLSSLAGFYGNTARKKALKLLSRGYYDYTGTDLHRYSMLEAYLEAQVDEKVLRKVQDVLDSYK